MPTFADQRHWSSRPDRCAERAARASAPDAGNTLLRPVVNAINRAPINQGSTEAIYEVRLTTSADHLDDGRELLRQTLESASYPLREIEVVDRESGEAELVASTPVSLTPKPSRPIWRPCARPNGSSIQSARSVDPRRCWPICQNWTR